MCAGEKHLTMHQKLVLPPGHEVQRSPILATCHFSAIVDLEGEPYSLERSSLEFGVLMPDGK